MAGRTTARWILAGLLALTTALYLPVRSHGWIYEDDNWLSQLPEKPLVVHLPSRDVAVASHVLTWRVVGLDPMAYHLGNLVLHLVNGSLVYAVSAALIPGPAAVWGAGVFLLHPLNSAAVNYVSARTDLLMTLGVLLAIWLSCGRVTVWRGVGIALALILATGSKEIGVVGMPLVAWTLLRWRAGSPQTRWVLAGCAMSLGAVLGMAWPTIVSWFEMPAFVGGPALGWPEYLVLQLSACWHLLALVLPSPLWLHGFSIDHDALAITEAGRISAVALTLISGLALVSLWRVASVLTWSMAFVAISVGPRFLFRTSEFLTEPHMYLPMVGISVLLGVAAHAFWSWLWNWAPDRLVERTV